MTQRAGRRCPAGEARRERGTSDRAPEEQGGASKARALAGAQRRQMTQLSHSTAAPRMGGSRRFVTRGSGRSSVREFRTVGVVGLGTMGAGIVEVFARNGLQVLAAEVDAAAVERGKAHLETSTKRAVERGKLTEEQAAELLGRITTTTSLADLAPCDLV